MKPFRTLTALAMAASLATGASATVSNDKFAAVGWYDPGMVAPNTSHTSDPSNWRFNSSTVINGFSFDGVARIAFDNDGSLNDGFSVCSGTLLSGGTHVLTAAHCADDFNIMLVQFGVNNNSATATRGVTTAYVHPGWTGTNLGEGADIAIIELDAPVTNIPGFNISTTNDVGKTMLVMGYGTTTTGSSTSPSNWNEWGHGHYGYNRADVGVIEFDQTAFPGNTWSYYGDEYMFDFDNGLAVNDSLGRYAAENGTSWGSDLGAGAQEALIAGGDSGGPDFVWSGTEWLISGVHSYGYFSFCTSFSIVPTCDVSTGANGVGGNWGNTTSFGDVSGSTAVFSHAAWINGIANPVPEASTYAMMLLGLAAVGAAARRRKG